MMNAGVPLVLVMVLGGHAAAGPCERNAKLELHAVDNDSAYMKKVFVHVGLTTRNEATDPAAIKAGLRADIDNWRNDAAAAKSENDYYVAGADRGAIEKYITGYEAVPADRALGFQHVEASGKAKAYWRTYYMVKAPLLDTRAIADVSGAKSPATGAPMVTFRLTPEGQKAFADATRASTGKKIAMMVDGDVMSAPIINGPITGGQFSVNLDTQKDADALLARFQCRK